MCVCVCVSAGLLSVSLHSSKLNSSLRAYCSFAVTFISSVTISLHMSRLLSRALGGINDYLFSFLASSIV